MRSGAGSPPPAGTATLSRAKNDLMRLSQRSFRLSLIALVLVGCTQSPSPDQEQGVLRALTEDLLLPMGDVIVVSRTSHCETQGQTDAPLPAALFNALLLANHDDATTPDLAATSPKLQLDQSGQSPRLLRARSNKTVVAISNVGLAGDAAVACLEVYGGTEERGFFLVFSRDGTGEWSTASELEAWRHQTPVVEELPDGTPYQASRAQSDNSRHWERQQCQYPTTRRVPPCSTVRMGAASLG